MRYAEGGEPAGAAARGGRVLARLCDWWRRRGELDALDAADLARVAGDVGITASELKQLAAHGSHAADELRDRMRTLDIERDDVERIAPGAMRDLERTCTCCAAKGVCARDLEVCPDDPSWERYCPNATELTWLKAAKQRGA